jgi:SAM-dependent methyltransferase
MDFKKYYEGNKTYITHTDTRLNKIIQLVVDLHPNHILDIGCGDGYLTNLLSDRLPQAEVFGIDVYPKDKSFKGKYKKGDITEGLPYSANEFDCIILGEVIEHVPNPDFVLHEIHRTLKKNGVLIISTPNLVSWANRILVPLGIQPLFTETSSETVLGRLHPVLGQGSKVQGHLKIFTFRSLEEILIKEKFKILQKMGVPFFFPFPLSLVDKFFTRFITLTSGLLYVAQKK